MRRVCPATLRVPSRYERKINNFDTSRKFAYAHIVLSRDRYRRFFKGLPMRVPSDREPRHEIKSLYVTGGVAVGEIHHGRPASLLSGEASSSYPKTISP